MVKKIILAVLLLALLIAVFALAKLLDREMDPVERLPSEESVTEETEETLPPGVEEWYEDDEETSEISGEEMTGQPDQNQTSTEPTNATTGSATTPTNPTTGGTTTPTNPTTPTTGTETTQPTTPASGNEQTTEPTTVPANSAPAKLTYEEYEDMTAAQQREFMMSFADVEDFFDWYNQAKAEYEAQHPDIEIGDGKVEIGKQP